MIIPPSVATAQSSSALGPTNDNDEPGKPSLSNLLMAAAEMHKMGRLGRKAPTKPATVSKEPTA